ncbi:MAG: hypothetical protein EA384_13565 [Spirochaetaceae bacterium]|nr:MAG: hypothetical protein EA384_13565 [Spirochaetaceae bacterium]
MGAGQWYRTLLRVIVLISLLPFSLAAQHNGDRQLAMVYVAEASSLLQRGEHGAAADVARRGLQFAEDSSDLHALLATAHLPSVERTQQVLEAFERAFEHDRFVRLDATDVAADYARLLLRVGRPSDAVALLESLRVDTLLYPDLLYMESRALFALGRVRHGEQRASAGIRVYLDDPRFFRLLLERQPVAGYRDYLAVRRYERDSVDYRRLLLTYAERVNPTPHRREVLEHYFRGGGEDALASLLLLQDGRDQAAELERFRRLGGDREHDLLLRAYAALNGQLRQMLVEQMRDFEGQLIVDSDRNGVPEQLMDFRDGQLERWRIDARQDGVVELDVEFREAVPHRVEQRGPAGFSLLEYGNYPEVRTIRFENDEVTVYYPIAERLEILLLDPETAAFGDPADENRLPAVLQPLRLHPQGLLVDRDAVERNAAYVEHFRYGAQRPYRVTELADGVPLRSVEDLTGDGSVDHILIYRDGQPMEGMRDLLGSGRFEVLEQYRDGRLYRLSVISEPGQAAEFYQEFNDLEILRWDFDRDGIPDVEERYFGDQLIMRLYASGADGVFDLPIGFLREILNSGIIE